jgi:hypothetical protein
LRSSLSHEGSNTGFALGKVHTPRMYILLEMRRNLYNKSHQTEISIDSQWWEVERMRRIKTTAFGVIVIAVLVFMITEAQSIGAPWIFIAVAIFMIVLIVISVVRAWLRL